MHSTGDVGYGIRTSMASVRVIGVGSRLSLGLTLVLKPDSHGFNFPVISDNVAGCQVNVDKTRKKKHIHAACLCDCFAVVPRRM